MQDVQIIQNQLKKKYKVTFNMTINLLFVKKDLCIINIMYDTDIGILTFFYVYNII